MYNRVGEVDNAAGVYQAVEGFTSEPFLPLRAVHSPEISLCKAERHPLKTLWDQRPSWLRIMHHDEGDWNFQERVINVVTSIPFIVLGLQVPRKTFPSKLYGGSLCGVGIASTLYHVSSGAARKNFRYADYAMIAASSVCLSGAIRKDNSTALMIASALALPFSPFLVSVIHACLMEATFAQRVKAEPSLRKAHGIHKLSSGLGGVLFIADDVFPNTPWVHAAWHLTAAVGVATSAPLIL